MGVKKRGSEQRNEEKDLLYVLYISFAVLGLPPGPRAFNYRYLAERFAARDSLRNRMADVNYQPPPPTPRDRQDSAPRPRFYLLYRSRVF